jgi:hypothetical protein
MNNKYVRARDAAIVARKVFLPFGKRKVRKLETKADQERFLGFFADPSFLGFAVAEKRVAGGIIPGVFCLTFFVRKKLPLSRLTGAARIPKRLRVHTLSTSVTTDVREQNEMFVAHRGSMSGLSIGHVSGTAGTLTFIARDLLTGTPLFLSCSHVLARGGIARPGDSIESPADPLGKTEPTVVGHLTSRFMAIDPTIYNTIDAALASPGESINWHAAIPVHLPLKILDLRNVAPEVLKEVKVGKHGASTGFQSGTITGNHATVPIRFPELGDRVAWFTDLVLHDILSQQGDSGAAVLINDRDVVGMHIAGNGSSGCFTHIQPVLTVLEIEPWVNSMP